MSDKVAGMGSVVGIHYTGGVKGEEPGDVREDGAPLIFMIGDMKVPRGIEEALKGMHEGEEKEFDISPEMGYGEYQKNLSQWYPRSMLKDGYNLKLGSFLWYNDENNQMKMPAFVTEETKDNVRIDLNHPWAGKELHYKVKLVEILK